ncbi:RNA polymerase sigma factor [Conexibacter sp. SYSU D00693]|uniref:RNA polymerase sigma factor n=1 Tax=Conexibacter sp. SYSU D00693 TaxID=2812560 RepID=UPI00196B7190|nr:RNA polymerase sigma factor [Conexibacter sp. SYSU D00693]
MTATHHVRIAGGSAFAEVFDEHFDAVHRYLHRRAGDAAEDLAAETFERALRAFGTFDARRGPVRAWLFGIATNVVAAHRRAEGRRLRAYAREAGRRPAADDVPDVGAGVDAARQARRAAEALRALSPEDRDVLLLVAWADLRYDEVASALGVPVGTVRSRLHRARAAVRDHLEGR